MTDRRTLYEDLCRRAHLLLDGGTGTGVCVSPVGFLVVNGDCVRLLPAQHYEPTDRIIELLNMREEPIVFLLWGAFAKSKAALITNPNHHILTAAHPSPLSAYNGFYGCKHFSKANALLKEPIDWRLD